MSVQDGIPFWRRVTVRLTAAICVAALAVFGLSVQAGLRAQKSHLEEVASRLADILSESIKNSTHDHMLADRRQDAYATMESIGRGEGLESVRIFNKEGRITFSTRPKETGTFVDKNAESCYACHAADRPLERLSLPSRSRTYRGADGHRILAMVAPIYNEPSCAAAACHAHPGTQTVLGVVDVGISLRHVDATLASLRQRTLGVAALAVGLLGAAVLFLASVLVVRPVEALLAGTERVTRGDLGRGITVARDDEIGRLASSFNRMTESRAAAQGQIEGLMQGLERKVEERTAALKEAQAQVVHSAKMASLGRLAASVAHEINNPLTGILTFARVIKRSLAEESGPAVRDKSLAQLSLVERETERCTAIIRNLLDFARARPLTPGETDPARVLDEALSLVGHQLALKSIHVEKHLVGVPPLHADFGQLRQAFVNVLLNASDAMGVGGKLRIAIGPANDGRIEIRFEDDGAGISPENLERIFDPFFTTKEKGTGLGLSVVYGIVERHGGELLVSSTVGQGTTLRMLFSAASASPTAAPPTPAGVVST